MDFKFYANDSRESPYLTPYKFFEKGDVAIVTWAP